MKQKLLSFLLALSALTLTACAGPDSFSDIVTTELPELSVNDFLDSSGAAPEEAPVTAAPEEDPGTTAGSDGVQWEDPAAPSLDEDGTYNSKDDVSLYLHLYDHLERRQRGGLRAGVRHRRRPLRQSGGAAPQSGRQNLL